MYRRWTPIQQLSEEALQLPQERWEVKSKGERERYAQLNDEFQRRARKNKKAFLSKQCEEIEGYNRERKTRNLFKNIGDMKGKFHSGMGMIKDKNEMVRTQPKILRVCVKNA